VSEQQPRAGETAIQAFDASSVTRHGETSALALAEQAKAAVQARFIVAMQRPRDLMRSRERILADCRRPGFAKTAVYAKPVGNSTVSGPGIRMAEAFARALGNIATNVSAIYDSPEQRIVRVEATDLEANLTYPYDVTIAKTIERSRPLAGRRIISTRKNSKGYDTFLLEATDDEIVDKQNALVSKALRTCILRLVPGDLLEEALEACKATERGEIAKDPRDSLRNMVDAFRRIGVSADMLAAYLGHKIDDATPEEIADLRAVWNAIRDKETTWSEVAANHDQASPRTVEAEGQTAPVADRMTAKAAKAAPATPAAPVELDENGNPLPPVKF
jgi:hypothetical protein